MNGQQTINAIAKDRPLMIDDVDSPYAHNEALRALIYRRGR
jgi:N-acetylneuraminate synthase